MPNVIGVRVTLHLKSVTTHSEARSYHRNDDGALHVIASGGGYMATYQPDAWDVVELVYGEAIDARISHLTAEKVEQPERSGFAWPYARPWTPVSDEDASAELLALVTAAVDRYLTGTVDLDGEHPGMTFESPLLGKWFAFAVDPGIEDRRESFIATIHGELLAAWRYSVGRDDAA